MSAAPRICRDLSPERLSRLDRAIFGQTAPPDALHGAWDEAGYGHLLANPAVGAWIAQADGATDVGLLCTQIVHDEGEVYRIGVLPAFRRQGLARALLDAWLRHAAARGVRSVSLDVRAGNAPAIALYGGLGFAAAARRGAYYVAPPEDALIMRWAAPAAPGAAPRR